MPNLMVQLALFCALAVGPILVRCQKAFLHASPNCTGDNYFLAQGIPDLAAENWKKQAYSVKITGTWLFYDYPSYQVSNNQQAYAVSSHSGEYKCFNLPPPFRGNVKSARPVGDPLDYKTNTLTLYTNINFQGDAKVFKNDGNTFQTYRSLIVMGPSAFTIYGRRNFQGYSICILPYQGGNYFASLAPNIEAPPLNMWSSYTIKSVQRGCLSKHVIHLPPFTEGRSLEITTA